jgi:acetolactate synthase-1/2/3 large subunit
MTGAEILIDALKKEGVDILFGYPGGVVIPIFDVLYRTKDIRVILTRHEQGAAHAADGYARATGKVGVSLVTSGPGATNTITGIATAKLDSVPLIVISGQVKTDVIGTDAFQETDMFALTRSICKHNYLVQAIEELPQIVKNAFHIAQSGRRGPVSIDIPVDVLNASLGNYTYPKTVNLRGYNPTPRGNSKQINKLSQAIHIARRPLILGGGGIISSGASEELIRFLEKTNIPTAITLMGLGCIPWDHKLFLGMPGMHGRVAANYALMECDLLIGIGTRFDDRVTGHLDSFARSARIAHIDIDPSEIGKTLRTDIPIVGDVKNVLTELLAVVQPRKPDKWNRRTSAWKEKNPLKYNQPKSDEILPEYVIDRINSFVNSEAIIVTDVGQHQMWTALYFNHKKPRSFISSGGLGTMGFGLPAAMGASLGCPERTVILISGDGSIQMNIQELTTCSLNNIPVKIIVLNNFYLGMVRQWQELFWNGNYSKTCLRENVSCPGNCRAHYLSCSQPYWPDFVKVAEANGMAGLRATQPSDVDSVLKEGLNRKGPVLMEFIVKKNENVYPMVPTGKPINEIILG